ncbi:MAG: HAMP domain-containing histidine kinase [Candidatus Omnitrophica bacterium]|nr:HAMP domain-containing histidine kinase [Candidatus Omnitrophota bacterium]
MPDQVRPTYSLRQRLDLIAGGMLFLVALGGCVALELARRQWQDTKLLQVLHEQERSVEEVIRAGEVLGTLRLQHQTLDPERITRVREGLQRLTKTLHTLQRGGTLVLSEDRLFQVKAVRDLRMLHRLKTAMAAVGRYWAHFDTLTGGEAARSLEGLVSLQQELSRDAQALRTFIQSLSTEAEGRSILAVIRASQLQLVVMFSGVLLFLIGALLHRHLITTPLQEIADGIGAMQRTGQLSKLPGRYSNELAVVASGFNQLAEQVEEQKRRLREQIVELERLNAELDQLSTMKDDFLETINHQLRTPVTSIRECIGLIRDGTLGPISDEQQPFVRTMEENALRLVNLIEEALDLSLLKSGRRPLQRQADDLTALLRQIRDGWQSMTPSCTVRLSCATLPPVYMDAKAIREVMDHLLRNALRHAPSDTEVLIEVRARDGVVEVSVHDQGPGISQEQQARLFQPFTHIQQPEAPGSQGSGLGLAFCRQVIERHRGAIRTESSEGHGTTFTFSLPIASERFLFEEICHRAEEEAGYEEGQFGLLLAVPADAGLTLPTAKEMIRQAELMLRRHTHRGDQFVWLDDLTFVIVAVTNQAGLEAMGLRLREVLRSNQLNVHLASAVFPLDGETPERLLEVARSRLIEPHRAGGHATIDPSRLGVS